MIIVMEECVDCRLKIEDGYKILCPPCHVFAANGLSNRSAELMERFKKANVQSKKGEKHDR